jgi:two-component system, NarL family, nitrate/nitrite response regulator NarL
MCRSLKAHSGGVWRRGNPTAVPARSNPTATGRSNALTSREIDIIRFVCAGLRNRRIAKEPRIGETPVKIHLHQIYEKLKLRGRLQLSLSKGLM